jgi:phospholipase C
MPPSSNVPVNVPVLRARRAAALLACTLAGAGCAGHADLSPPVGGTTVPQAKPPATRIAKAASPISHVVIVVQENRSFDDLWNGFKHADTVSQGLDSKGQLLKLQPVSLDQQVDLGHGLATFLAGWDNGKMDGFDLEEGGGAPNYYPYEYVQQSDTVPYWQLAKEYVLSDRTFTSQVDSSFVAHQYLIAGQAQNSVDIPTGAWGCSGNGTDLVNTITAQRGYGPRQFPCFDYTTLADELDAAGLTWRFYAPTIDAAGGIWSAYQAIDHIYQSGGGSQWLSDVISPETGVLTFAPDGKLPNVTWVIPDMANSDHPSSGSKTGPSWVAQVVNAIGASPYWKNTVIFVMWDDWGGWYDHVPPPQLDVDGLGIRTAMLCISPYAPLGKVSHVQLETASILRYVEDNFGLAQMAASDARATSAGKGCLDYTRHPRAFTPILAPYSTQFFLHQPHSYKPPDDD